MEHPLIYPAHYSPLPAEEAACISGGAEATGFALFLENVGKISKVLNFMARIFSSSSAMLNNFITTYNTITQLNDYIDKNF